jgi:WxL domain surface cell wall-binding
MTRVRNTTKKVNRGEVVLMTHARRPGRTLARLVTGGLVTAGVVASTVLAAGPALAGPCGGSAAAGTSCTLTGTFALSAGTMTWTSSSSLGWAGTVTGLDQQLVDTTSGDQGYVVNDASGTAPGWHVTLSATQFTTGGGSPSVLNDTGTFSTNGSVSSYSANSAPSSACATGSTCTLPTDTTTYPVAVTTAASSPNAFTIYDASAGTGSGKINIGGSSASNPVGWWLSVPANTLSGTYTSTITLELISGP